MESEIPRLQEDKPGRGNSGSLRRGRGIAGTDGIDVQEKGLKNLLGGDMEVTGNLGLGHGEMAQQVKDLP